MMVMRPAPCVQPPGQIAMHTAKHTCIGWNLSRPSRNTQHKHTTNLAHCSLSHYATKRLVQLPSSSKNRPRTDTQTCRPDQQAHNMPAESNRHPHRDHTQHHDCAHICGYKWDACVSNHECSLLAHSRVALLRSMQASQEQMSLESNTPPGDADTQAQPTSTHHGFASYAHRSAHTKTTLTSRAGQPVES